MSHHLIIDLYERYAEQFDATRGKFGQEQAWLDSFLHNVPKGGTIVDLGCGSGEPIAQYILQRGAHIVGVDAAPAMIAMCRRRFPRATWHVGDMRSLPSVLSHTKYHGIIAWNSLFHLTPSDQIRVLKQLSNYVQPGSPLLFTSGPEAGIAIGEWHGQPLYHASLSSEQYKDILHEQGFRVLNHVIKDPSCGDHTVWLAIYDGAV